jgi:hypothetical protein
MRMRILSIALLFAAPALAQIPDGFTKIPAGPNLEGWHISQVNHHGNTPWKVENGVLLATQDKKDNGGIILTDKKYRNFEVYLELNPDFGCDGGLFLRASEKGEAYQIMLDYLQGGSMGGVYGERLTGVRGAPVREWEKHWKKGEWNTIRARIEGVVPRIQVWMNGTQVLDWTDTENHLVGGAQDGMIAVQVHRGARCSPGLYHRFRNVAVKELP